ncbi:hypothetical protein ACHAWC_001222 [Mediolabrus comicus]
MMDLSSNPPSPPKTRRSNTVTNLWNNASTRSVHFDLDLATDDVSTASHPPSATSCAHLPYINIHNDAALNHQQTQPNTASCTEENNNQRHNDGDGNNVHPPPTVNDIVPFDAIPPIWIDMIKAAIHDLTGISTPHQYQIETIYHGIKEDDTTMYLVRKTSAGKSLVPQTIAFFRNAISVLLVPLHGLGCHQTDKSSFAEHNVEAYHIDEHHGDDADLLRKRLNCMSMEEAEYVTIMLYISPQKLKADSDWFHILKDLAAKGLISMFCIDEAHYVQQAGRSFRVEFVEAVQSIATLRRKMPTPAPCIAISADCRVPERGLPSMQ